MSVNELGRPITAAARTPQAGRAWTIVGLLCGFLIVNYADKIVVGLAGADLMRDLSINAQQFGIVQSSFFWCFAAGSILGSFLIGRVPARFLLAGTAVLWVLSLLPMVWSESYELLIASRMMLGFAEGPATAMAVAVAHTWFTADRRAVPTSVIVAGAGLGPVIAAPLLTLVIVSSSWHGAFAVLAMVGLIWVPMWLVYGREGGVLDTSVVADIEEERLPWLTILRNRTVLGVAILMFATYCSSAVKISWLPLYLHSGLGYDKESVGSLVALPYGATAVLVVVAGLVSRLMTKRGVANRLSRGVLPSLMLAAAGISTLGFSVLDRGLPNLILIIFGASLAGGAAGITLTAVSDVVPGRQRGAVLGFIVAVYSSAGVISPVVLGGIVSAAASPAAGYRQGFLVLGVVMVVGAAISILLINPDRDTNGPRQRLPQA